MTEKTDRKALDWERIESQYRAGIMSLREIADDHGISEGAIRKRAKRDDWARDLGAKIQQRADDLVRKAEVRAEVRSTQSATDREVIEASALRIAQVRGEHRHDITRMRSLILRLLAECEAEAAEPGVFAGIGDILRAPDDRGMDRLNDAYQKAISLPTRIKGVKELAETMKTLVGLEREAYGIVSAEDAKAPPPGIDVSKLSTAALAELMALRDAQRK